MPASTVFTGKAFGFATPCRQPTHAYWLCDGLGARGADRFAPGLAAARGGGVSTDSRYAASALAVSELVA